MLYNFNSGATSSVCVCVCVKKINFPHVMTPSLFLIKINEKRREKLLFQCVCDVCHEFRQV